MEATATGRARTLKTGNKESLRRNQGQKLRKNMVVVNAEIAGGERDSGR
jgi:hypothetical protein